MRRMDLEELPAGPAVRSALARFLEEARDAWGERIQRVVVFGSVARGEAREAGGPDERSDVDLFVVWDGTEGEALEALVPITLAILRDTGVDLAVHPISPERLHRIEAAETSFYRNVQGDGILVAG